MKGAAAYSASKSALTGFSAAMGTELRRQKIRILDVRSPHTQTSLHTRPISGVSPPQGQALSSKFSVLSSKFQVLSSRFSRSQRRYGSARRYWQKIGRKLQHGSLINTVDTIEAKIVALASEDDINGLVHYV